MRIVPLICAAALLTAPAFADDDKKAASKADHYFNKMDTDGDGMVSSMEHSNYATKKFNDADSNKDKMLSKQEMVSMKEQKKKEMKDSKYKSSDDSSGM